jgi:GNAT superfamily N-acetyltransferase
MATGRCRRHRNGSATKSPAISRSPLPEVRGLASVAIAHLGIDLERLLFLKDLFVRGNARNAGVGRALIGFLAGYCLREGISRLDLTTEDWNEGALRFYAGLGAERHGQKVFLRLSGEALATTAAKS